MDIATTLKEFRQEHGLEQEDLAKLLDTTQQTVSNWESGTMPRTNALRRINHVLATYQKGVGAAPYVEPPRIQGDGYPTFASTMIPKEEIALRNHADNTGPVRVKSEYETRRAVAESLASTTGPSNNAERIALLRSMRQDFEEKLSDLLDKSIEFQLEATVDFQSLRQRADYLSPRVCAEIKIPHRFDYMIAESGVHQLLTMREILKRNNQAREYFVLILVVTPGASLGMRPMALSRIVTLASIHDVHVFITGSAEETAQILSELETGTIDDLRDKYIEDLI